MDTISGQAKVAVPLFFSVVAYCNSTTPLASVTSATLYSTSAFPRLMAAITIGDLNASLGKRWCLSRITIATPNTLLNCSGSWRTTNDTAAFGSNWLETK
jgi:hypothetical protein